MIITLQGHGAPFLMRSESMLISGHSKDGIESIKMDPKIKSMVGYTKVIKEHISELHNTNILLKLRSCYSANGGRFCSAQYLADKLGATVEAYYGKTTLQGGVVGSLTNPNTSANNKKIFHPHSSSIAKSITSIGYKVGYKFVDMIIPSNKLENMPSVFFQHSK